MACDNCGPAGNCRSLPKGVSKSKGLERIPQIGGNVASGTEGICCTIATIWHIFPQRE